MPYGLSPLAASWMVAAILGSALVRGYSGFGFSALVIAASSLVTNPLHFVAVVMICEMAMTAQAWTGIGPDVDWRRVWLLVGGAVLGLPFGLWLLTALSEDAARAVISGFILVMCAILLAGWHMKGEAGKLSTLAAGVVSGVANAPGMGGLPVAAFFAAQPMRAAVFRATLVGYFPLLDLYSAPLYWWHGLIGWDTLRVSLVALPLCFFGNWLGSRHFLKTGPQEFRRFAIFLLAGLAALGLLRAVV